MRYVGIGIDSIAIARFDEWHKKSRPTLRRIYTEQEIDYCLNIPTKSAERFAGRFALREATLKALQPLLAKPLPLLTLCSHIAVIKNEHGAPTIAISQNLIKTFLKPHANPAFLCSLTTTTTTATAIVLIQEY